MLTVHEYVDVNGLRVRGSIGEPDTRVFRQLISDGNGGHYLPVHDGQRCGVNVLNLDWPHMVGLPTHVIMGDKVTNLFEGNPETDLTLLTSDNGFMEIVEAGGRPDYRSTTIDGFKLPGSQMRPFMFRTDGDVHGASIRVYLRLPVDRSLTFQKLQLPSSGRGSFGDSGLVPNKRLQTGNEYDPRTKLVIDVTFISFAQARQMLADAGVRDPDFWDFSRLALDGK